MSTSASGVSRLSENEQSALAALVDKYDLAAVVESLSDVAAAKAEHMRGNKRESWKRNSRHLFRCMLKLET